MTGRMITGFRNCAFGTATILMAIVSAGAEPTGDANILDVRISETRVICARGPSTNCSRAIHRVMDSDGDDMVSLDEIDSARMQATRLVHDRKSSLSPEERTIFGLAVFGLISAGPPQVFANFDTDKNGALDHDEMFADIRLDQRPFATVVNDPGAVDWTSLANRFGKLGQTLIRQLPAQAAQ